MEAKSDTTKLPDMVMCGDHPSFTKTELNLKVPSESKMEKKEKELTPSCARISPTSSHTDRNERSARPRSEHALRVYDTRRHGRALDAAQRADMDVQGNRALVQAALSSFRWPPYLLCVWLAVLLLTHTLHCLVAALSRALPAMRKCCQYFRTWTEDSWQHDTDLNHRVYPIALACVTGLLYSLYCVLYVAYCAAVWAIEPLCELETKHSTGDMPKITNYVEEAALNSSDKL